MSLNLYLFAERRIDLRRQALGKPLPSRVVVMVKVPERIAVGLTFVDEVPRVVEQHDLARLVECPQDRQGKGMSWFRATHR